MENNNYNNFDELEELSEDEILTDQKDDTVELNNETTNDLDDNKETEDKVDEVTESKTEEQPKIETLPNEIGRVKNVGADTVTIGITTNLPFEKNLIDHHVIFRNTDGRVIVGMVTSLNSEESQIKLIGELQGVRFAPGVLIKPSIGCVCFMATEDEIKLIVVDDKNTITKKFLLGSMPLYGNAPAYVSTNAFFSNHFAIFGNTGSGKSCGVARLFQNVFFNQPEVPKNACIFIFDAYGEY